jgi:hypothetical protein
MKLRLSEKQLQQQIQYFAYYQLAGGFIITGITLLALARAEHLSSLLLLAYLAFLGLSGFATYCGYLCLKLPTRARGLQLSRLSLLAQFLGFAVGGFSFRFFAGPFVALSIDLTKEVLFKADASLGEFNFKVSPESDTLLLSINVVAMLLFFRTTFWLNEWRIRYGTSKPAANSV